MSLKSRTGGCWSGRASFILEQMLGQGRAVLLRDGFFLAEDKVQVKYEMLRALSSMASGHGRQRQSRLFACRLLSGGGRVRGGRDGGAARRASEAERPDQVDPISWPSSTTSRPHREPTEIVEAVSARFGDWVASTHRQSGLRAVRVFWPISESAQADYEALRAAVLWPSSPGQRGRGCVSAVTDWPGSSTRPWPTGLYCGL